MHLPFRATFEDNVSIWKKIDQFPRRFNPLIVLKNSKLPSYANATKKIRMRRIRRGGKRSRGLLMEGVGKTDTEDGRGRRVGCEVVRTKNPLWVRISQ